MFNSRAIVVTNATMHVGITLQDDDGNIFKVNGHRLKVFHEHNIPEQEVDMIDSVINSNLI